MKKTLVLLFTLLVSLTLKPLTILAQDSEDIVTIAKNAGYPATAEMAPKGAIVLNAEDGQILWASNENAIRDPASTTKTMVVYLVFEAISQGKIALDTKVVATENDQAIANIYELSNNKIVAGETYTVSELLTMTLVPSSNVATLMLAHLIHGNDDASFIRLMNDTAKQLGMTNTRFHNGTGAIVEAFQGHYAPAGYNHSIPNDTTAKDLAILAYHLIKKHPDVLQFTNKSSVTVKKGTPLEETFKAYNYSLSGGKYAFEGVDGLKTGSSPSAGFNGIITGKQGDVRVIMVLLGVGDWSNQDGEYYRHYFVNGMLKKIFKEYQRKEIAPAGQVEVDGQKVTIDKPLYGLVKNGQVPQLTVANNRLQVAGTIDNESGVTLAQTKASGKKKSTKPVGLFQSDIKQHWPLVLLFAGLLLLVFLAPTLVIKARNKSKRSGTGDAGQYSRRNRR